MGNLNTATTILGQLGGAKFIAMTGARDLVDGNGTLVFALPSRLTKAGINKVSIRLTPWDTYDVTFYKIRGINFKIISEHGGIYADGLQELFTRETGLDTRL